MRLILLTLLLLIATPTWADDFEDRYYVTLETGINATSDVYVGATAFENKDYSADWGAHEGMLALRYTWGGSDRSQVEEDEEFE